MAFKRVNMNLDADLVKLVDDYAASLHINRSAALSVILSRFFEERAVMHTLSGLVDRLPADSASDSDA